MILEYIPWSVAREDGRWSTDVQALAGQNGVYLIGDRRDGNLLYIGESHTGRLYGTITRHYQQWSDSFDTAGVQYEFDGPNDYTQIAIAVIDEMISPPSLVQDLLVMHCRPQDNRYMPTDEDIQNRITEGAYDEVQLENAGGTARQIVELAEIVCDFPEEEGIPF